MTVNVSKPAFNLREKLSELDRPVGNHGSQLMKSSDITETFNLVGAGRRNIVINGDMSISQRYGTTAHTIPGANTYVLDRWGGWSNQASKFSIQQVADAPTEEGLKYSTKCTSLSAFSAGNSDWFGYNYRIEANDITQGLLGTRNAKIFTLSFWVKSSVVGKWSGAIRTKGSSPDRSYPFDYTINSVDAWEKKTVTFKGAVDGTWGSGTAEGMCLWWDLGTGSTFQGTANKWHSANKTGSKASPFIANNGATWYITGVQLELGPVATPFEHRSYGEELALCQRYFWREYKGTYEYSPGPTNGGGTIGQGTHPVTMRVKPTMSHSCTGSSVGNNGINSSAGQWTWYKQNSGYDGGASSYQTVANWNFATTPVNWHGGSYNFRPSDTSNTTALQTGELTYIQAAAEL